MISFKATITRKLTRPKTTQGNKQFRGHERSPANRPFCHAERDKIRANKACSKFREAQTTSGLAHGIPNPSTNLFVWRERPQHRKLLRRFSSSAIAPARTLTAAGWGREIAALRRGQSEDEIAFWGCAEKLRAHHTTGQWSCTATRCEREVISISRTRRCRSIECFRVNPA